MMLNIRDKRSFRKDYRKLRSSGKDLSKLAIVIDALAAGETLAESYRDHPPLLAIRRILLRIGRDPHTPSLIVSPR